MAGRKPRRESRAVPSRKATARPQSTKKTDAPKAAQTGSSADSEASKPDNKFPIVGIGASAGGLEAMTRLLRAMPPSNPMALVLVQHLDPRHESMLVDILGRETPMPVMEVRDGMRALPRHLYVIPPDSVMELVDGSFRVAKRRSTTGRPPLPVDEFFTSLAEIQKSASIGVILSGNASDGMLGMRAIKSEGGITFAQDESAQFQGMPRAAISAGAADFVMPPEEIARELERIARHPFLYVEKGKEQRPDAETLRKIFGMIRSATGVDFAFYRQTTILRRLARRMAVNKIVNYGEYLTLLKKTPAEVTALFDDFLISVTAFFRDTDTFELLQQRVIPELLKARPADQALRVWVPGCATGEEAYSLAICLVEAQDPSRPLDIQIFATDVSDNAIERARQGVYDESALHNVSAERLRRFFVKVDGRFQVAKAIRDVCIFARQNVATDPPFSHLDILSCRNLLIYLEPALQRRLFPLFHHVLKPNGYLVLGPAESAATFGDLFTPIDKRHRVFAKRVTSARVAPLAILPRQFGEPTRIGGPPQRTREEDLASPDLPKEIDRVLIGRYAPPAVVVNSNLEIVQFRGKTGAVLEPASGAANLNVLAMAREGLLPDLRASIHKAKSRDVRVRKEGIRVRSNGGFRTVNLEVVPLKSEGPSGRLYLVLFEAQEDHKSAPRPAETPAQRSDGRRMSVARREIERMTKELASTKEYLQAVIEEQESTNEELKSANEEILSSNEELQSTNEELDTAKEELQSANEELTTLNEELQNRNAQLSRANDDLVNLLHSVQIPIVMLGSEGRIRRFTPAAERLLNLIPSDVGRPLQNIRPNLDVPDLVGLVLDTVDTITPKQVEIRDRDGRWHLMRIQPYRTLENKIDGAVLSFFDIDAQKTSALEAEKARDYAEAIVETVPEAILVLDEHFVVQRANNAYYRLFRTTPDQTTGRSLFELGGGHWDVPGLKKRLQENHTQEVEVEKIFDRIGLRTMLLRGRWARFGAETGGEVLLSIEDVTERRQNERQLQSSEAQYRGVFDSANEGAMVLDAESGEIADVNRYVTEFLGAPREALVGKKPWELSFVSGADNLRRYVAGMEGSAPLGDITFSGHQGHTLLMEVVQRVFLPGERKQLMLSDVTQRRRLEQELRHVQKMESIGRLAGGMAHDFNNILNIISAYAETLKRGGDAAKVADAATAISKSVARGAGVVRQLLTFARKDEAAFRAVSVNEVVRESVLMVAEMFPKTVRVVTELSDRLPDVMADPDQLHQTLLNLFVNARDAMPEGGELRLSTRRLEQKEVRERHPEATALSYVRIDVSDTGVGMDAETRARIFEPFFTTKERGAGSGMGLAVVYGVVGSHRGFVDVESDRGKGTTFRLYLPVLASSIARPSRGSRRAAAPVKGGSETILFVEDEKELLESVTELLEQEGYTVLAARTGEQALSLYRQNRGEISLVVTDVELPEMSGWDAFRKMHEEYPDIRAVLVSGYLDPPMRARMLQGGAKGFLRKPYTLDEMLRTMREVLDEESAAPTEPEPPKKRTGGKKR